MGIERFTPLILTPAEARFVFWVRVLHSLGYAVVLGLQGGLLAAVFAAFIGYFLGLMTAGVLVRLYHLALELQVLRALFLALVVGFAAWVVSLLVRLVVLCCSLL